MRFTLAYIRSLKFAYVSSGFFFLFSNFSRIFSLFLFTFMTNNLPDKELTEKGRPAKEASEYRIAGNFRGVKYSFFSWQADLDENFTPRKPTVTHLIQLAHSEANEIFTHETHRCSSSTKFLPHENYPLYIIIRYSTKAKISRNHEE